MPTKPRKPKLNLSVFRPGDLFLVKSPVIVERWGYPLSHTVAAKHVEDTFGEEIAALFARLGANVDAENTAPDIVRCGVALRRSEDSMVSHWDHKRVVSGLASHWLKLKHFGGNLRSLHTRVEPALKDVECRVVGRKTVKTGTRYAATSSGPDYDGEYDYAPGGLENEQTHVLLEFRPVCALDELMVTSTEDVLPRLWIEAKNVTKTYDSATNQRIDPITQKPLDKDAFKWQSIPTHEECCAETAALSEFVERHLSK